MHLHINSTYTSFQGVTSLNRVCVRSFFQLAPNFPITNPTYKHQALFPCKIKAILHIKGAAKSSVN